MSHKTLRPALRDRINTIVEPKTKEEIELHRQKAEAIRDAHLDAVKERGARDIQRTAEVAERKRQATESEASRIIDKMEAAASKCLARKQAQEQQRAEALAKRQALADAVTSARAKAHIEVLKRGVAEAERACQASDKREQLVHNVAAKGEAEFNRARAVVEAKKVAEAEEAAEAAERLQQRLAVAAERRNEPPREMSAKRAKAAAAKRQVQAVELEQKRAKDAAAMEKATAKREVLLGTIADCCKLFNIHAAEIAEAVRAHADSDGEARTKYKAALYERLVSAEVTRAMTLRAKATHGKRTFHPEVIVVPKPARSSHPPPAKDLLKRLCTPSSKLLATAATRQLSALARREAKASRQHQAAVEKLARSAAVAQRRALQRAESLAAIRARELRAGMLLADKEGDHAELLAKEAALATMVHANRAAADEEVAAKAVEYQAKAEAASERRAAVLRRRAKVGVASVRQSAASSRRKALAAVLVKNGALHEQRCMQAETTRMAELGARVFLAQESGRSYATRYQPIE